MTSLLHNRKALIALAVVFAVVAIVIPTCRMTGCTMQMGGAMPFGHQSTLGLFSDCGGSYIVNGTPLAVVPGGLDGLVLTLAAAVLAVVALFSRDDSSGRLVRVWGSLPPPPPDDPLGTRLRI